MESRDRELDSDNLIVNPEWFLTAHRLGEAASILAEVIEWERSAAATDTAAAGRLAAAESKLDDLNSILDGACQASLADKVRLVSDALRLGQTDQSPPSDPYLVWLLPKI